MARENIIYDGEEPYAFISYKRENKDIVEAIAAELAAKGVRLWYDTALEGEGEENFKGVLEKKIRGSKCVLFFASKEAVTSKWCGMELMTAYPDISIITFALLDAQAVRDNDGSKDKALDQMIPNVLGVLKDKEILKIVEPFELNGDNKQQVNNLFKMISHQPDNLIHNLEIDGDTVIKCHDARANVVISPEVRKIGNEAFKEAKQLKTIDLGSVEEIGDEAFCNCDSIEELIIPETVKFIGEYAFKDCESLKKVIFKTVDEAGKTIELGESVFDGCVKLEKVQLPRNINELPSGFFNGCKELKKVNLEGVSTLGESAFEGCKKLDNSVIVDSLCIMDDQAFADCDGLEDVVLPRALKKMGKDVFKDCTNLKTVNIGHGVSFIGLSPFRGCVNLKKIDVDTKNHYFRSEDKEVVLYNKNRSTLICYPASCNKKNFEILESITVIAPWAFAYSDKLQYVKLSDSIDEIRENAFYRCKSLTKMLIPDGVTLIDDMAFKQCANLEEVLLPESVDNIGWAVFSGCPKVKIYCLEGSHVHKLLQKKKYNTIPLNQEEYKEKYDSMENEIAENIKKSIATEIAENFDNITETKISERIGNFGKINVSEQVSRLGKIINPLRSK